jgi:hypothetical protein
MPKAAAAFDAEDIHAVMAAQTAQVESSVNSIRSS